jgi:hypothetical protein
MFPNLNKENIMRTDLLFKNADNDRYKNLTTMDMANAGKLMDSVEVANVLQQDVDKRIEKINNGLASFKELFANKCLKYNKLPIDQIVELVSKEDEKIYSMTLVFNKIIDKCSRDQKISKLFQEFKKEEIKLTQRVESGQGGTYFGEMSDPKKQVVISPTGEGGFEAHNSKGFADINSNFVVPESIPNYEDPLRKCATFRVSIEISTESNIEGFLEITPKTVPMVLEGGPNQECKVKFHYLTDALNENFSEIEKTLKNKLQPSYTRPCAVQEKISNLGTVYQFLEDAIKKIESECDLQNEPCSKGLKAQKNKIEKKLREFLKDNFSNYNFSLIFAWLWITGENDGNLQNFLVCEDVDPDSKKDTNSKSYKLIKIDEGQTFPRKNRGFKNFLNDLFPQINNELDPKVKSIIKNINIDNICNILEDFELSESVIATKVRIQHLQRLIEEYPNLSMKKLNQQMLKINSKAKEFKRENNPVFEVEENIDNQAAFKLSPVELTNMDIAIEGINRTLEDIDRTIKVVEDKDSENTDIAIEILTPDELEVPENLYKSTIFKGINAKEDGKLYVNSNHAGFELCKLYYHIEMRKGNSFQVNNLKIGSKVKKWLLLVKKSKNNE